MTDRRVCACPDCRTVLSNLNPNETCWEHTPDGAAFVDHAPSAIIWNRKRAYAPGPIHYGLADGRLTQAESDAYWSGDWTTGGDT